MKYREGRGRGVVEARTTIEFAWEGRELAKGLITPHITLWIVDAWGVRYTQPHSPP